MTQLFQESALQQPAVGFLKYEGKLVDDGYLDARKTAEILTGFDQAIRFFLSQENSAIAEMDFEIPVKVQSGSWEALVKALIILPLTAGATTYAVTATKKMAENDFKDVGLQDFLVKALRLLVWSINIAKHTYKYGKQQFTDLDWKTRQGESLVGIKGVDGNMLYVPKDILTKLDKVPNKLLSKNALIVESERTLKVGYYANGKIAEEAIVTTVEKHIFTAAEEGQDLLYPELIHGQTVTIRGHLTKGNEDQNSLGLKYKDNILHCTPKESHTRIVDYKDALFENCEVLGVVDRSCRENPEEVERKPRIKFETITVIPTNQDPTLFGLIE